MAIFSFSPRHPLLPALLGLSLLAAACHDPHKKFILNPSAKVQESRGEQAARAGAPFADELVRYLRGAPREQGDAFILQLRFAPGAFAPEMDSIGDLEALLVIMRDFPELRIAIEGHTDSEGEPEKNLKLSQWRAEWVRRFLLERGIAEDRVEAEGYGDTRPIADNSTPEGQAKNRRLVVRVLNFATQSTALSGPKNKKAADKDRD